jgi:hypothetical protein
VQLSSGSISVSAIIKQKIITPNISLLHNCTLLRSQSRTRITRFLTDTYSGAQGERLFSRAPDVNSQNRRSYEFTSQNIHFKQISLLFCYLCISYQVILTQMHNFTPIPTAFYFFPCKNTLKTHFYYFFSYF